MNTVRRVLATFTAMLAVIAGIVLVFTSTSPANADNCTTDSRGTTYCNTTVVSRSISNFSSSVVSVASSDASGKTNLSYEMSNGFTKPVTSCPKVASYTKVPRGAKCFSLTKAGYHYQNSGVNRYGKRIYFDDYVGSKYTPVGSKFYLDSHTGVWRKANCGNYTRFSGTQALKVASVVLVRTFNNVTANVKVIAQATGKVTSTASCSSNGASASGTATGTGTATATATASAAARTVEQATSTVANQLKSSVSNDALTKALAAASVDMQSSAAAWCQSSSTSSPTPSPSTSSSPTPSPSPSASPTPTPSQSSPPVTCYSAYGPGYSGTYPNCTKDGTAASPPPTQAPGPNPSPSNTTSSQCYDPNTGQPVAPGTPGAWC